MSDINPSDLQITPQADTNKDFFNFKSAGLKINKTYSIKFQWVYPDGLVSDWSPGYFLNTATEAVPGAPAVTIPSTSVGSIPVTLTVFPENAKRVDIYIIGGIYGTGKVADSFLSSGTKTIAVGEAGVYQVSLITVTPSGINGDPTNTFTITVTGQQQVVESPTLPAGLSVSSSPFAVSVNWGGLYSGSGFQGFKSIDIHVRGSNVGSTAVSGFSTTTQVATLTVNSTTNIQNIGLDNLRQALGLASNSAAYTAPMFFYYISRNENDSLYSVSGTPTYTLINSSTVNPTKANFVDLESGIISIENLVAGDGQFSSWLRTGSSGGTRIELSGVNDFTSDGYTVQKGLVAYSSGSTEIFNLDIDAAKLTIKGDGEFTGNLSIGTGNDIFKAEPGTGIWLGNSSFGSASFSVSRSGILKANSGTIGGWAINSTQLRSNGVNQISLNQQAPKIAIIQGSTLNTSTGLYEGGSEKITIDPVEGIVGPNITVGGSVVPSFKLTPSGNLTLYGSITVTGGQLQTDLTTINSNVNTATNTANFANDTAVAANNATNSLSSVALKKGGFAVENASNQITSINANGITISSTGFKLNTDTTATIGSGQLVLNSAGITARNSLGANTFVINATTGSAQFAGTITASEITGSTLKTASSGFGSVQIVSANNSVEFLASNDSVIGSIHTFSDNEILIQRGPTSFLGYPASNGYLSISPGGFSIGRANAQGSLQYGISFSSSLGLVTGTLGSTSNGTLALQEFRNISMGTGAKLTTDTDGVRGDIWIQYS